MRRDSWRRLEALFQRALALPASQREAFLEAECADDPDLLAEAKQLVAAGGTQVAPDRLGEAVAKAAGDMVADSGTPLLGRTIGSYRILREIGAGGMGAVYLAERADQEYDKQVAIKVVRGGFLDEVGRAQFRTERQILATLEHPNIARMLDGGTTDDGTPFVVMEYVDGVPLDEYANREHLDLSQRLALFQRVCDAVQFAHSKLIIHRDLKPSNILVTPEGSPKLLDFGVAKLVTASDTEPSTIALTSGARMMTPEYASPEQIRRKQVSTATDVYSLGVVLYELLTGRRPYEVRDLSPAQLEEVVATRTPERPSQAVTTIAVTTGEAAGTGGADVRTLSRQLRGDLDWIVLKALRKEPERRYLTVGDLARDVQRHLDGLPVSAGPNTWRYRLKKFATRNAAALIVATGVVALSAFYVVRLAQERTAARIAAQKAERVAEFVTGLFTVSDPNASAGRDISVREALDSGAVRLRTELSAEPEVRADLMRVVGNVYAAIGDADKALELLRESLAGATAAAGEDSDLVVSAKHALAILLTPRGELDEAEEFAREVLAYRRSQRPPDRRNLLLSLQGLSRVLQAKGDYGPADSLESEALALARELPGPVSDTMVALALNNRGLLRQRSGRMEEAGEDLESALALRRELLDPDHSHLATSMNNLALVRQQLGELDESEALFREAMESALRRLGPEHSTVAVTMGNLATVLKDKGRFAESEDLEERALEIKLASMGPRSPNVRVSYNNLANLRQDLGDPDSALALHKRALDLAIELGGEESPDAATSYYNMAAVHRQLGNLPGALELQQAALHVDSVTLGPEHPFIVGDFNTIGETLRMMEDYAEAESYLLRGLELGIRVLGADHTDVARSHHQLAACYLSLNRMDEALEQARESVRVLALTLPPDHWEMGSMQSLLGEVLWSSGLNDEAEPLLRTGWEVLSAGRGPDHALTVRARERLEVAGLPLSP